MRPLFDVLGSDNAFFVARGNTPSDILVFAIGLTVIPPLALTLIEMIVRAVSLMASRVVHIIFVALLTALIALQFVKSSFVASTPALLVALAIGLLVAAGFWKTAAVRSFMTVLTPASFIFLALFIFASPVSDVITPSAEGSSTYRGSQQSGNATPVVLVIYDELPAAMLMDKKTNINAARFPAFADLGKTSTWYKNNTTISDGTWSAVPAILTGFVPADKRVGSMNAIAPKQSIYTMLAASHRVGNVEAITHVCPPAICEPEPAGDTKTRLTALYNDLTVVAKRTVLPKQMADKLPAVNSGYGDFGAASENAADKSVQLKVNDPKARFSASPPIAEVNGASFNNDRLRVAARMQNSISGAGKPPLYVIHMLIPHIPWRFTPDGEQYALGEDWTPGMKGEIWTKDSYLPNLALQRATLQAEFGDKILAGIVTKMKQAGIWDSSLMIVTADHGVSYRPGAPRRPVTEDNLPELANTPLFVKYPGQTKGVVNTQPTRSVDIAPTVAQVTKTGDGLKFDGIPLDAKHRLTRVAVRNAREKTKVTGDWADVIRRRDELVGEWTTTFPGGQEGLLRLGPNQNLIGRQVASLRSTTTTASGVITYPYNYSKINRKSGVLQIYMVGSLTGLAAGAPLAASVDGKIVAVGESFETPDGMQFGIILPPASLSGTHAYVQLFAVSDGSTLAPLANAGR